MAFISISGPEAPLILETVAMKLSINSIQNHLQMYTGHCLCCQHVINRIPFEFINFAQFAMDTLLTTLAEFSADKEFSIECGWRWIGQKKAP